MNHHDIARLRLINQRLAGNPLTTPAEIVQWFGAVQSQEYPYAKWGLSQRAPSHRDIDIEQALTDGTILRTHAMRPTWHFVAAADIRWLQDLTGPRVHIVNRSLYRNYELDEPLLTRARHLITQALRDGNYLTRQELAAILEAAGILAAGPRLAFIVMHNELDAVICSGPRRGRQFTYALVEERVPGARQLPRDEALAELTRRYFTSHGPATMKDFVWWSGLLTADARSGIALLGASIERFEASGTTFFHIPSGHEPAAEPPGARLLQAYDEYVVAYTESRPVLNIAGLITATSAGRPLYYHPLTLGGQLAGHWRRRDKARSTTLDVMPARPLTVNEREALDAEVARFAGFIDMPVSLTGLD